MILTGDFFSNALATNVTIKVIVPTPEGEEQLVDNTQTQASELPVVYLLHGAYGNYHSWTRFSNVERYAQQHQCVLVMASAENSFYHNLKDGREYYTFFIDELRQNINNIFPVSRKRERTYLAGFSMGGYGAWYLALRNPHVFSKAASMSGALDLAYLYSIKQYRESDKPINWKNLFDDPSTIEGGPSDLLALYDQISDASCKPKLYLSCGTEDPLYKLNVSMHERLKARGYIPTYHETSGGHDWDFWDAEIQRVLDWLFSE